MSNAQCIYNYMRLCTYQYIILINRYKFDFNLKSWNCCFRATAVELGNSLFNNLSFFFAILFSKRLKNGKNMSVCTIIFKHLQIMHRVAYLYIMIYNVFYCIIQLVRKQSSRSHLAHVLVYILYIGVDMRQIQTIIDESIYYIVIN